MELRRLDRDQIERFLNRWCRAYERRLSPESPEAEIERIAAAEVAGILKSVDGNEGVKRLASNPLLLTILSQIHREGTQLPSRRVELYEEATKILLRDWQLARGISSKSVIDESEALETLAPFAYWLHSEKVVGLASEDEIKRELSRILADLRGVDVEDPSLPRAVADLLRKTHDVAGLIVWFPPRHYGFQHQTFQEYFAARELTRRSRQAEQKIYAKRHQPRWEEPILLAIAHESRRSRQDAADWIRHAILAEAPEFAPSRFEDVLHRDLLMAAQCLADCASVEAALQKKVLERLIATYFDASAGAKYGPLRDLILDRLQALARAGAGDATTKMMLPYLKAQHSSSVRGSAAYALGQLGSERAMEGLLDALKTDSESNVRGFAAFALGRLGSERAMEGLLDALKTDSESDTIVSAASALGTLANNPRIGINHAVFGGVAGALRALLDSPGFDESILVGDQHYSHRYDVIWEALWNVCQNQGIV